MKHQQFIIQNHINESEVASDVTSQNLIEAKLADFFANTIATVSHKKRMGERLNDCEQELLAALEEILTSSES